MRLASSEFENNGQIPSKFTCDGANISPPLNIEEIPENTKTLALIMDDPDAPMGTFVHWVTWNIKPTTKIPEAQKTGLEGINGFGNLGYGGPCPPSGTHRYVFKLYALNAEIDLNRGATKKDLEDAMKDHILAKAELVGKYSRS